MTRKSALLLLSLLPVLLLGCATQEEMQEEFKTEGLPYIEAVVPASAVPGQTINLRGFNFGTTPGQLFIGDGGAGAIIPMPIDHWADDLVVTRVPQTTYVNVDVPINLITSDNRQLPVHPKLRVAAPPSSN